MRMESSFQIKIGAIISYVSIAINILLALVYTPWMVREIGQSDYGLYTLATSLISLFLVDFGLSSATSRFVAKYRAEGNREGLNNFLVAIYRLYLLIDAIIFLILIIVFFASGNIYKNLSPVELERFKVVYCIAGVYSIISFPCITFNGILTAYEKFIPLKVADLFQRVFTVVVTIVALILGLGLYALVIVNAVSGVISIIIKYYYVRKTLQVNFKSALVSKKLYLEIFQFSIWTAVWALAQRLIFNVTPTILGMTVASASIAIAIFGVVQTLEAAIYNITTAINGMFLSRITNIITDDPEGRELTKLAIKIGKFQFALNGLLLVGFAIVGKEFILLWMGPDYISAYYCVLLVTIPGIFYNALQIADTAIVAQNLVRYQAFIQILVGVFNLVVSCILSSKFGVIGASISICLAYVLRIILAIVIYSKHLSINMYEFVKKCYLRMLIPTFISLITSYAVTIEIGASSWALLVLKSVVVLFIYLICMLLFGFSKSEIFRMRTRANSFFDKR